MLFLLATKGLKGFSLCPIGFIYFSEKKLIFNMILCSTRSLYHSGLLFPDKYNYVWGTQWGFLEKSWATHVPRTKRDVFERAERTGRCHCKAFLCYIWQTVDTGKVGDWGRWEHVALKGCGISVLGIFLTCLHTGLSNLVRIHCFSCFKKNVGLRAHTQGPSDLKVSKKTDLYWFGMSRGRYWIFFLHSWDNCVLFCNFSLPIMKKMKQNTYSY